MFGKRKKRREAIRNKLREKSEYKMKSENVAIPEIHTKDFDEIEEHIDEIEQEKEEKHSILYDNVAIPEVHIHKKKKQNSIYQIFYKKNPDLQDFPAKNRGSTSFQLWLRYTAFFFIDLLCSCSHLCI